MGDGPQHDGAWLRRAVLLLLAVAAIACAGVLLRSCSIAPEDGGERAQSPRQLAEAEAWHDAVRDYHRNRSLMALVFLLGNGCILAAVAQATLARVAEVDARRLSASDARASVKRRGALGLVGAFAILVAVPALQSWFTRDHLYAGEQGMMGALTALSFVLVWAACLGMAFVVLREQGGAEPRN